MAHPIFRLVVLVVFALAAIGIAVFGVVALRQGGTLPGILCLVVAAAVSGFPIYDAWQFARAARR